MLSTIQLLIALGLDRTALVADLVVTAAVAGVVAVAVTRSRRRQPPVTGADAASAVVAEAEAVVDDAGRRQPA